MRLIELALKGMTRFRDPLRLNLRELPPGLVAIVGPNGEGKTTLLETPLAAISLTFPSRDNPLATYATAKDSHLEAVIDLEGRGTFRARVNVDGVKRNSDAVLEQLGPHGTSTRLNPDGKVTTYRAAVADVFPSTDVMLASTFSAQNQAGNFIGKKPKERKELFAELLGLKHYEHICQTAKTAAGLAEQARGRLVAVRDRLAQDTGDEIVTALDQRANALQAEIGKAQVREREVQAQVEQLEARLAMVADQVAAYQAANLRVSTLTGELNSRTRESDALTEQLKTAGDDLKRTIDGLRARATSDRLTVEERVQTHDVTAAAELTRLRADYDAKRADLRERVTNNRGLLDQAEAIRAAVATVARVAQELTDARASERSLRDRLTALSTEQQAVAAQRQTLAGLRDQLARAERAQDTLSTVPCGGVGDYAGCRFLTDAQQASAEVPRLRDAIAAYPNLDDRDLALQTEHARTIEQLTALVNDRMPALEREGMRAREVASAADKLAAAEARIAELEQQIAGLDRDQPPAEVELQAKQASRRQELVDLLIAIDAELPLAEARAQVDHQARVAALQQQHEAASAAIARLAGDLMTARADLDTTAAGSQQAQAIQSELATARTERDGLVGAVARIEAEAAHLNAERAKVQAGRQELADLSGRITALDDELLSWQTIARAFSRDGLQTLEIDAAGPAVSAYANEIMAFCIGPRFTLELVTQEARADGKGLKEEFTVKVYDNERGGEARDIGDLSGGEQVIVSEALMNAIAVYVNRTSPQPMRTCWRDETTGALDPANAQRYVAMLRKVQELGGFHHVFFITHNPDAAAQADAQIRVESGSASIVLPPFTEAA